MIVNGRSRWHLFHLVFMYAWFSQCSIETLHLAEIQRAYQPHSTFNRRIRHISHWLARNSQKWNQNCTHVRRLKEQPKIDASEEKIVIKDVLCFVTILFAWMEFQPFSSSFHSWWLMILVLHDYSSIIALRAKLSVCLFVGLLPR